MDSSYNSRYLELIDVSKEIGYDGVIKNPLFESISYEHQDFVEWLFIKHQYKIECKADPMTSFKMNFRYRVDDLNKDRTFFSDIPYDNFDKCYEDAMIKICKFIIEERNFLLGGDNIKLID